MEKKELIIFLKKVLEESIKKYYVNEINYRTSTSLVMSNPGSQEVLAKQTSFLKTKAPLEVEISQLRGIIDELEKDTLKMI